MWNQRNKNRITAFFVIVFLLSFLSCRKDGLSKTTPIPDNFGSAKGSNTAWGAIDGSFNVGKNGQANYTIPLPLPPGINKIEPRLWLEYQSQGKNGVLGIGWELKGLSSITRTRPIVADQGLPGSIQYTNSDRFSLDGQRLLNIKGGYGDDGTIYHTEIETWQKVISKKKSGNGPQYFLVYLKDGTCYEYGKTSDSRIEAEGESEIRVWAVNKITDTNGNSIIFNYTNSPLKQEHESELYISSIEYTSNSRLFLSRGNRSVQFEYEARDDIQTKYQGGSVVKMAARLKAINTYVGRTRVFNFSFKYDYSPGTKRSRLAAIKQSGFDRENKRYSLPETSFEWQGNDENCFDTQVIHTQGGPSDATLTWWPADINGDGRNDFVHLWKDYHDQLCFTVYLAQSDGSFFEPGIETVTAMNADAGDLLRPADVNGDGKTDIIQAVTDGSNKLEVFSYLAKDGGSFTKKPLESQTDETTADYLWTMDINGDGRTDLVQGWKDNDNHLNFITLPADEEGRFTTASHTATECAVSDDDYLWPMEVNGDGMIDLVQAWKDEKDTLQLAAFLSNGKGFKDSPVYTDTQNPAANLAFYPVDSNGDGLTDLVQQWQSNDKLFLSVYLSRGNGTFAKELSKQVGAYDEDTWSGPADINGDGKTDFVRAWLTSDNKLQLQPYMGRPEGTFYDGKQTNTGAVVYESEFWPMDVNGDGKCDLVRTEVEQGRLNFHTHLSIGKKQDLVSKITDGIGGVTNINYDSISNSDVYSYNESDNSKKTAGVLSSPRALTPKLMPVQRALGGVLHVVSSYTFTNDASINSAPYRYNYNLTYGDAKISRTGRGWLGFGFIKQTDLQEGNCTLTYYKQEFPFSGIVSSVENLGIKRYSDDSRLTNPETLLSAAYNNSSSKTVYTSLSGLKPPVYLVLTNSAREDYYHYGRYEFSLQKNYDYDEHGNKILISNLNYVDLDGKDITLEDNVYTIMDYLNKTDNDQWLIGFVQNQKVSRSSDSRSISTFNDKYDFSMSEVNYTTDGTMNIEKLKKWDDVNQLWLTESFSYDKWGNKITATDWAQNVTQYSYETEYNTYVQSITYAPNEQGKSLKVYTSYDPRFGMQVAKTDENQNTFISCPDPFGRLKAVQGPLPDHAATKSQVQELSLLPPLATNSKKIDQTNLITLSTYKWKAGQGEMYKETKKLQSWEGEDTTKERTFKSYYDGRKRVIKTLSQTDPENGYIVNSSLYNSHNSVVKQSLPYFSSGTPLWIENSYDVYKRLIKTVRPDGVAGTEKSVTTQEYENSRLVTITHGAADTYKSIKKLSYDHYNGKAVTGKMTIVNDNNAVTSYSYDILGRIIKTAEPESKSNPEGIINLLTYDSLGRKITVNNPDQNTTGDSSIKAFTYYYGKKGLLEWEKDALGNITQFQYDSRNRVIEKRLWDSSLITYEYDSLESKNGLGRLCKASVTEKEGALKSSSSFDYDPYGNKSVIIRRIEDNTYKSEAAYDPQGRIYRSTYPDGTSVIKHYAHGNLVSAAYEDTVYAEYSSFDPNSKPRLVRYGNGLTQKYSYCPNGRLLTNHVSGEKENFLNKTIHWNHINQITGISDNLKLENQDLTQSFQYSSQRLINARGVYGNRDYLYDQNGNITQKGEWTFEYHAHRVVKGTSSSGDRLIFEYYLNGAMRTQKKGNDTFRYSYNGFDRLSRVEKNGKTALIALYDYSGERIKKVDEKGIATIYAGPLYQITRYPDKKQVVTKYIKGSSGIIASLSTGNNIEQPEPGYPTTGTLYFIKDHLGSTSMTFNEKGVFKSQTVYLPYGSLYKSSFKGDDNFRQKFQGKELDFSTGLYYFGKRYYNPVTGRFITPDDQIGRDNFFAQDALNRFAFGVNAPILYIDPTGESIWENILGATISILEIAAGIALDVVTAGAAAQIGGGTLIGAGINGLFYSASSGNGYSWKDFGKQQAIGAVQGALTAGFGSLGTSLASKAASSMAQASIRIGVGMAGGAVTGMSTTMVSNALSGNNLFSGTGMAALTGAGSGLAGSALGELGNYTKVNKCFSGEGGPWYKKAGREAGKLFIDADQNPAFGESAKALIKRIGKTFATSSAKGFGLSIASQTVMDGNVDWNSAVQDAASSAIKSTVKESMRTHDSAPQEYHYEIEMQTF